MFTDLGRIVSGVFNFIVGVAILGLVFRVLLRLFGANPTADFVRFIYDSTTPLLSPFRGIFQSEVISKDHVLEFSTLFAIVIYLLVAWLVTELIEFVTYNANRTYRKM